MFLLLLFAFISGLITILAPCIWPLLPIILSSTSSGGHRKPLGITLGVMTSFSIFTLTISYLVKLIHFDPNSLRIFAVVLISFLGIILVIPKLTQILEGWVSRLTGKFVPVSSQQGSGFWSGYLTGFSLGLIWSPCAGPILATIATLAATQQVNLNIILVTLFYVIGIGIPLFIFATLGNLFFTKTKLLSPYLGRIQQIFGIIMIATAILIFTNYDKVLQAKLLDFFPAYSSYLYKLETQSGVQKQLDILKGVTPSQAPNYLPAPEFVGISKWLNLPAGRQVLTMQDLRGKVVLVDFWTYTCINCIRTLPHVISWYEKYNNPSLCSGTLRSSATPSDLKDKCFVVIGVHTPEFEFEKKTENVQNAIKQYGINYPVAQDNDYATWNTYQNHYWPAEYLIDTKGNIRRTHFGEGEYDQTEKAIQDLLKEANLDGDMNLTNMPDLTPKSNLTPETYLGLSRREGFGDSWTLGGDWETQDEYIASKENSGLDFNFKAGKVFLVLTPATAADILEVSLDGKLINTLTIDQSKLYTLVDLPEVGSHKLHLNFKTQGTKAFAFTFGD